MESTEEEDEQSAIIIQSVYRGHLVRKDLKNQEPCQEEQENRHRASGETNHEVDEQELSFTTADDCTDKSSSDAAKENSTKEGENAKDCSCVRVEDIKKCQAEKALLFSENTTGKGAEKDVSKDVGKNELQESGPSETIEKLPKEEYDGRYYDYQGYFEEIPEVGEVPKKQELKPEHANKCFKSVKIIDLCCDDDADDPDERCSEALQDMDQPEINIYVNSCDVCDDEETVSCEDKDATDQIAMDNDINEESALLKDIKSISFAKNIEETCVCNDGCYDDYGSEDEGCFEESETFKKHRKTTNIEMCDDGDDTDEESPKKSKKKKKKGKRRHSRVRISQSSDDESSQIFELEIEISKLTDMEPSDDSIEIENVNADDCKEDKHSDKKKNDK